MIFFNLVNFVSFFFRIHINENLFLELIGLLVVRHYSMPSRIIKTKWKICCKTLMPCALW